jgi:phosphotransferase system  glucose/maltose/N-acetylglucosamine-specific IIC component
MLQDTEVGTSISNLPAGTYTVTVTDNCSSKSNSVTMGQPAAALAIGTSSKTLLLGTCNWICNCWYCNWVGTNCNYSWKNASNTEVGTTASISNLPAGTSVTVTTVLLKSNSVTIGQPAAALAIGTSSKTDASCFGTSTGSVTAGTVTGVER